MSKETGGNDKKVTFFLVFYTCSSEDLIVYLTLWWGNQGVSSSGVKLEWTGTYRGKMESGLQKQSALLLSPWGHGTVECKQIQIQIPLPKGTL